MGRWMASGPAGVDRPLSVVYRLLHVCARCRVFRGSTKRGRVKARRGGRSSVGSCRPNVSWTRSRDLLHCESRDSQRPWPANFKSPSVICKASTRVRVWSGNQPEEANLRVSGAVKVSSSSPTKQNILESKTAHARENTSSGIPPPRALYKHGVTILRH